MTSGAARGIYGFRLDGITPTAGLLIDVAPDAIPMTVRVISGDEPATPDWPPLTDVLMEGARMGVDTSRNLAVYHFPSERCGDDMVHPWLVPAVSKLAVAHGRTVLHGGLLAYEGRALAIIADREGGKSSLLAYAAAHHSGLSVLADDLVVLEGGIVHAGPRCIDLRTGSLAAFPQITVLPARSATRHRMLLRPCNPTAELAGFVHLRWGESLSIAPVAPGHRLRELLPHMSAGTDGNHLKSLLALAELPSWHLSRPRDWTALDATLELLQEAVSS